MKLTIGNKQGNKEQSKIAFAEHTEGRHEIVGKRGSKSKLFTDENGKMTAEYYGKPVHYFDIEENKYKEVDNRLKKTDDGYELNANTFKTHFHKRAKDGKIFEMEKDMCKVGLIFKDAAAKNGCELEDCTCGDEGTCDVCSLMLHAVKGGTDIEYTVDSERVKENIIVKAKADKYEYDFNLSLENLAVGVSDDGKRLELKKKDSGNVQFYIPSPFMTDADGKYSDNVYYEIVQETEDMLNIKVIADKDWINAEGRAFPVTIDPQIVAAQYVGTYYYTDSGYNDTIFRYKTIQNNKQVGNELRVYCDLDSSPVKIINSELIILKNKIPNYIIDNLNKAELKIRTKLNCYGPFYIGDYYFYAEKDKKNECIADITNLLKEDKNEIVVSIENDLTRNGAVNKNIYFEAPRLTLEYERSLSRLEIVVPPDKTTYGAGETFDKTGMVVKAYYDDGTSKTVTNYTYAPSGVLSSNNTYVTISYTESGVTKTATQAITVTRTLQSIKITTASTKINYIPGETFNKTGMVVKAYYNDGTSKTVTDYTYSPSGVLTTSNTYITISYTENGVTKATTQAITVAQPLTGIAITAAPTKINYTVGETRLIKRAWQ